MGIMNKVFAIGGAAALAAAQASALEPARVIEVDKGEVTVVLSEGQKDYALTYKKPDECQAQVIVREEGSKVIVQHVGAPCQSGSAFQLELSAAKSARVSLRYGRLALGQAAKAIKGLGALNASVEAGTIKSSVSALKAVPSADYAGASVEYKGSNGQLPGLELTLSAGLMEF